MSKLITRKITEKKSKRKPRRLSRRIALGSYLRWHRQTHGWDMAEVVRRSGVSRAQITNIENGRSDPSLAALIKIAGAMDCDLTIDFKHRGFK